MLLFVVSCAESSIEKPSTFEVEDQYQICAAQDGSRIRLAKWLSPDGEESIQNYYDNELGRCSIQPYQSPNGTIDFACVPLWNSGKIYFSEGNCQKPIAYYRDEKFIEKYIGDPLIISECEATRLYKVGTKLADPPTSLFAFDSNGDCNVSAIPETGVYLESPGPLGINELIKFEKRATDRRSFDTKSIHWTRWLCDM